MDAVEHLRDHPDDRDRWRVFADELQTAGDPTGELCALEFTRGSDRRRAELERQRLDGVGRWSALDVAVTRAAAAGRFEASWFAGHLVGAALLNPWKGALGELLEQVLAAPCGRFLRALALEQEYPGNVAMGNLGTRGAWEWAAQALSLGAPAVERLVIGGDERASLELSERSSAMVTTGRPRTPGARICRPARWVGELQPLFVHLPRLRRLTVHGEGIAFSALPPTLSQLELRSRFVRASTLRALGATPLPQLTVLAVWPGNWPDSSVDFEAPEPELFYGRRTTPADLGALLSGTHVPKLAHLELSNTTWTQELLLALADSPLLRQLKNLDASQGSLGAGAVDELARHAPKFRHLERFDLSRNQIVDPSARAALQEALGPKTILSEQAIPRPDLLARLFS